MDIVKLLAAERKKVKSQLDSLDKALSALGKSAKREFKQVRKLSAAGRRRIALGQKKRWAKFRKKVTSIR